jgi:Trypsin/Secretion system C-terminal sorting domain
LKYISGGSVSNTLKRAAVEVTLVNSTNNKIIVGGNYNGTNYDACQGDSGGPLYASTNPNSSSSEFNVLIGTVNGGTGCGGGGAYMNVSKYLKWIVETILIEDTPNFLCGGSSVTLENIGKLPDGCTMGWSAFPSSLFLSTQIVAPASTGLTPTFKITAASGASGEATIQINMLTPDGPFTVSKKIWIGQPGSINIVTDGTFNINGSNATICKTFGYCMTSNATNGNISSANSFSYSGWPISNSFFGPPTTSVIINDRVCFGTNNTGSYFLTVYASNTCGTSSKNVIFQVNNCGFRVFPNPAQTTVAVEFEEPDKIESIPDIIDLVEEKSQKKVKSKDVKMIKEKEKNNHKAYGKIEIDVSDLPRGVYYLNMSYENKNGSKVEQARVILTDK